MAKKKGKKALWQNNNQGEHPCVACPSVKERGKNNQALTCSDRQCPSRDLPSEAGKSFEFLDDCQPVNPSFLLPFSEFLPIPSMSSSVINSAKLCLSHPFTRIKCIDQWAVDPDPCLDFDHFRQNWEDSNSSLIDRL